MVDFAFRRAYVDHHPDYNEYKVHAGGKGSKGSYHSDKEDAVNTAKAEYGKDVEIKHRSKRYGPEPD